VREPGEIPSEPRLATEGAPATDIDVATLVVPAVERVPAPSAEPLAPAADSAALSEGTVSGIVLLPEGGVAHHANVRFVWDDRGRAQEVGGEVDGDGRFVLELGARAVVGDLLACANDDEWAPAARTGVRAGTRGVELRLGPRSFFTVEGRDELQQPVELHSPLFYWQLAGLKVQDSPHSGDTWARSPVPFFVRVIANGYRERWFGPFEPESVGETLLLPLESFPRVRGRVIHAGQPVAGAGVCLEPVVPKAEMDVELAPRRLFPSLPFTTDELGRFELSIRHAARYEVVAVAFELGEGRVGPFELDGTRDLDGLEIELDRGFGTVEGRVQLPPGHEPGDIWLLASSGHGYRGLRPDGSYVLPDLTPGPCHIQIFERAHGAPVEESPGEDWTPSYSGGIYPAWLPTRPGFQVEVVSAETVRLDLDLANPAPCRLEGRIRLNEGPLEKRTDPSRTYDEDQVLLDPFDDSAWASVTKIGADGSFVLSAQTPRDYRLRLVHDIAGARGERWQVRDRVALQEGVVPWRLDVSTGSLRLLPADETRALWNVSPTVRWAGPGDLRVFVDRAEIEEQRGARVYHCVPAGRITLLQANGDEAPLDLECEIHAGETTEVVWPQ